jgi:hypothetical protein
MNKKMNRKELIRRVGASSGVDVGTVARVIDSLAAEISYAVLDEGQQVVIANFGRFAPVVYRRRVLKLGPDKTVIPRSRIYLAFTHARGNVRFRDRGEK